MAGAVISFVSTFPEMAAKFVRMGEAIDPIMQAELDMLIISLAEVGVTALMETTPVDTGKLRASTVPAWLVEEGDVFHLRLEQPAPNTKGVEYAPFVIAGYHSRAGRWIPGQWYNVTALDEMMPEVRYRLAASGRRIILQSTAALGDHR